MFNSHKTINPYCNHRYSNGKLSNFIKRTLLTCTTLSLACSFIALDTLQAAEPGVGNLRPAYGEGRATDTTINDLLSDFRKDIYNPDYHLNILDGQVNNWLTTNYGCASILSCNEAGRAAAAAHFQDFNLDLVWLRPDEIPTPGTTLRDYTPGSDYNKEVYTITGGSFEGIKARTPWNDYQFIPSSDSLGGVANDPGNPNTGVYRDIIVDRATLNVDGDILIVSRPTSHIYVVGAVDGATINFNGEHTYIYHDQQVGTHGLSVGYASSDATNKDRNATVNTNNLTIVHGTGYQITAAARTRSIVVGAMDLRDASFGRAVLNVNGDLRVEKRAWTAEGASMEVSRNGIANVTGNASLLVEADSQDVLLMTGGTLNVGKDLTIHQGSIYGEGNNNNLNGINVSGGNVFVENDINLITFSNSASGIRVSTITAIGPDENSLDVRGRIYTGNNLIANLGAQQFVNYFTDDYRGSKHSLSDVKGVFLEAGDFKIDGNADLSLVNISDSSGIDILDGGMWIDGTLSLRSEGKNQQITANSNLTGMTLNHENALFVVKGETTIDMQTDNSVGVLVTQGQVYLGSNGLTSPNATDFKNGNYALSAIDVALFDLTKGTINTAGETSQSVKLAAANAIHAQYTQSKDTSVTSSGDNSTSVLITTDLGKATFSSAGNVSSSGANSNAVDISSLSGNVVIQQETAGAIFTDGAASIAVKGVANQNATLDFNQQANASIWTTNSNSNAVDLQSSAGNITASVGGLINTANTGSDGLKITSTDGTINVQQNATSTISVDGSSANALNIIANNGAFDVSLAGIVDMSTNTIQTDNAAIKLQGQGSLIVATTGQVLANRDNIAILKTDTGNVDVESSGKIIGSILLTGAGDNSLFLTGFSGSTTSDMKQIDGGVGGTTDLTLSGIIDARAASGSNADINTETYLLNAYSDGVGTLTGISGETVSQLLNWQTISLTNKARLNMVGDLSQGNNVAIETFNIDASSTLSKTHIQQALLNAAMVNNEGRIDLRDSLDSANNIMTISGNYSGTQGSSLLVSTHWNNDPNPIITGNVYSSLSATDHLIIEGTATGQTAVYLPNNIIGDISVADITEPGRYEKLTVPVITVNTDHENAPAVFTGSAQTTNAGEAQLVKRGNDYVFVLQASNPLPYDPPVEPGKPNPNIPEKVVPIYSQAVSAYVQMPRANMELGYDMIGTFHERTGEPLVTQWDNCGYACAPMVNTQSWVRITGKHAQLDGEHRFGYEADTYIIQAGQDLYTHYDEDDQGAKTVLGVMGTYARLDNMKFYDNYRAENGMVVSDKRTGSGQVEAGGIGLYLTRIGARGAYLDVVGQVNYYNNKYDPRGGATTKSQDGYGIVLSAEVGAPYMIGQSSWYIEPQAQLIYQRIDLDDFHDGYRKVRQDSVDGLRGRAGLRLAHNTPTDYQRTKTLFIKGNIWYDFDSSYDVAIGRDIITEHYNDMWGEIGLGFQLPVTQSAYLFSDVSYSHSFSDEKREEYRGNLGLKVEW